MTKRGIGVRAGRLAAGGALALLLATGALGVGEPGQPGTAGRGTSANDPQAARGAITVQGAGVGLDRAGTRVGSAPGSRDST